MAFPTVTTPSPANIRAAAFLAVYVADSTTNKWQTLGSIAQGVMNVSDFSSPDTLTRNKAIGTSNFTAKCRMMQASYTELLLLASLCNGTNAFLFKLSDAAAIPTAGSTATTGWVKVTAAQAGVKARLVCDGTPEDLQYIELEWQGSILNTAKDALLKAAIDDDEFASSSDSATAVFYGIGKYTAAKDGGSPDNTHLRSCGVSTITLEDSAAAGQITISPITNVKMSFDMIAQEDGIRRFLPLAVDINVEYDWMATDNADLLLLDSMVNIDIDAVITMLSGTAFTLNNQVGIETNFEVSGDMDKHRVVRFTHKGKILQASLEAVVA